MCEGSSPTNIHKEKLVQHMCKETVSDSRRWKRWTRCVKRRWVTHGAGSDERDVTVRIVIFLKRQGLHRFRENFYKNKEIIQRLCGYHLWRLMSSFDRRPASSLRFKESGPQKLGIHTFMTYMYMYKFARVAKEAGLKLQAMALIPPWRQHCLWRHTHTCKS